MDFTAADAGEGAIAIDPKRRPARSKPPLYPERWNISDDDKVLLDQLPIYVGLDRRGHGALRVRLLEMEGLEKVFKFTKDCSIDEMLTQGILWHEEANNFYSDLGSLTKAELLRTCEERGVVHSIKQTTKQLRLCLMEALLLDFEKSAEVASLFTPAAASSSSAAAASSSAASTAAAKAAAKSTAKAAKAKAKAEANKGLFSHPSTVHGLDLALHDIDDVTGDRFDEAADDQQVLV